MKKSRTNGVVASEGVPQKSSFWGIVRATEPHDQQWNLNRLRAHLDADLRFLQPDCLADAFYRRGNLQNAQLASLGSFIKSGGKPRL